MSEFEFIVNTAFSPSSADGISVTFPGMMYISPCVPFACVENITETSYFPFLGTMILYAKYSSVLLNDRLSAPIAQVGVATPSTIKSLTVVVYES